MNHGFAGDVAPGRSNARFVDFDRWVEAMLVRGYEAVVGLS